MAILKRINKYQGLKDIDILVEEQGLTSQYFNVYDFPDQIPQGKSSFLIAGSPYLKNNVELKVEILDAGGNTIYTEAVTNYLEGGSRRVSVEVYDDVVPGDGFMYIVGELKPNYQSIAALNENQDEITSGEIDPQDLLEEVGGGNLTDDIPPEFQGVYNVRYIRPVFINATLPNTQPIFFYKQPTISLSEIVKPFVEETRPSASIEITGSVDVNKAPNITANQTGPTGQSEFDSTDVSGIDNVGQQLSLYKDRRQSKIEPLRNTSFSSRGRLVRRASPEEDRFTITINDLESSDENSSNQASSALVGGTLTINSPAVDDTKYPSEDYTIPSTYTTSIKKVKNQNTLVPLDDFIITRKDTGEKVVADIVHNTGGTPNVTMSYTPTPNVTLSNTHYRSFADITIANLRTFSGDVYKAKIYAKSKGTLGDFEPMYESTIESPTLLIDPFSKTGFVNEGYFYSSSIVDNYWVSSSNAVVTRDDSQFIDGILISGSNEAHGTKLTFETSASFDLEKNVTHTLRFNTHYYQGNKINANGTGSQDFDMQVYVHQSAIDGTSLATDKWYPLGRVQDATEEQGSIPSVFNTFITPSGATVDPKLKLKFEINSGRAIISDVEVGPYSETNFNPDFFRAIVPMPHPMPKKPDKYDFLVEFYDVNNNIAETVAIAEDADFLGASFNIDGDGNLLSGSMYLGNVEGSGIEMHGGSAFIRSIGYDGFDKTIASSSGGFMMFSGSVTDQIGSAETYNGVGLEIVDAHSSTDRYLKFRTNPSTFQVVTDEFFLGQSTSTFVSGSNGNLHISSSNFEIQPDGDVIMSGTITATAGNIGDFQIVDGQISGSNITMNATRSQIYKTDAGPGSDTGAAFEQLRDEYYIDFQPSESVDKVNNYRSGYYIKMGPNFGVDKDGILFASGATFQGTITASAGLIGGFTSDDHAFSSNNIFISGSPTAGGINQDKYMFISTSKFNVKQNGDVTGSSFLLEGGTITDGVTILGTVAANSILTPATIGGSPATVANASSSITAQGHAKFVSGSIAGWEMNPQYISKALGGHSTTATSRIYLSVEADNQAQNIQQGLHIYRDDDDTTDGHVKIVRVGGLSNTTTLHHNDDYGLQVIKKDSDNNYSNIMYIGKSEQKISGFSITPVAIHSTDNSLILSGSGEITGSQVLFTGGKIGGWTLTDTTLTGGVVTLNSAGSIEVGGLSDATTVATTNSGFFADSSGNVLIKGNVSNNDYLKVSAGGSIDIKAQNFDLDATSLIMDSGTNEGKIALGGTPPTAYNSGNGFYVDGTGKLLIGSGSGDRIQFDGSNFTVQVGSLELDASNVEISSTNASMSLGEGNIILDGDNSKIKVGATTSKQVEIVGSSTQGYIATGKTSATSTTAGFWLANNNTDPEFHVGNSTDFIKFDGGNLDIQSQKLEIDASTFEVSTTESSMSLGHSVSYPQGRIILQGSGTPKVAIGTDASFISMTTGSGIYMDGAGNFKFGDDDGNVSFNSGNFSITGSDVDIQVTDLNITAAGFKLSSTDASMSLGTNEQWYANGNGASPYLSIGQSTKAYSNPGVFLGYVNAQSRPRVSFSGSAGHFLFDTGVDIKTSTLEVQTTGIEISSAHTSMSIGPGGSNPIVIQSAGNDRFIKFGSKTDFAQTTTAGFIMGMDNGEAKFDMTVGSGNNNYFRAQNSGIDIKTPNFRLDTDRLDIDSSTSRIQVYDGEGDEVIRFGEISDSASDLYGLKVYDGAGTGSSDTLLKLGGEGNEIAGWTIANETLTGGAMVIRKDGTIESSGFASNVAGSGFRLTAAQGGFLEVENAKIRGTLATAVFEKESVNAVGGQLYVANSTVLTSSAFNPSGVHASTQNTMSVVNVTGFTANEVLSLKKVSTTGFGTEYVLVQSASRDYPDSETNFSGQLFVTRSYGSGISGDSGSLGETPGTAQAYSGSQVIVSTGKINTGYIRLNANPNDETTPYMDIVERTGSAIYDVNLKARLGDLSGLSSGLLYGNTNPGFGLFTENIFLTGAITATTGSFTGIVHINTSDSEQIKMGIDVNGSNDGIYINNNNYWYTNAAFKVGSSNYYLSNDSSGNIAIQPKTFELKAGTALNGYTDLRISSTQASMSLKNNDILMQASDDSAYLRVGRNVSKALILSGSQTFGSLSSGKTSFADTTTGIWIANSNSVQQMNIGTSTQYIKFDSTSGNLQIASDDIEVTASNVDITTGTISVDATDFEIESTVPSMSLGYDTNSNAGVTFTGGSPSKIHFGPKGSAKMLLSSTTSDNYLQIGSQTFTGTEGGIIIGSDSGTSKLKVYNHASSSLVFDGTDFDLRTVSFRVVTEGFDISGTSGTGTSNFLKLGSATSVTAGEGAYLDGGGNFRVGTATSGNSFVRYNPTSEELQVKTSNLNIDTTTMDIVASGSATRLSMGASPPTNFSSNGIIISGSGYFNLQAGIGNYIRNTSSGFDLKSQNFGLDAGTIIVSSSLSSGAIKLGSSAKDITETANTGVYMDGTGKFRVGTATSGDSYLHFDGSDLDIKTGVFKLDTSNLDIDSAAGGSGSIALGSTPPTDYTAGNGFFVDGSGKFLLGNSSGDHIKWNGSTLEVEGTINITGGTGIPTDADISGSISGSYLNQFSQSMQTQVVLSSAGMDLKNAAGNATLASYGTDMTIGQTTSTNRNVYVDSDAGIQLRRGTQISASFADNLITLGPTSGQHVHIDTDSIDIKNASSVLSTFGANSTIYGGTVSFNDNTRDRIIIDSTSTRYYDEDGTIISEQKNGVLTLGGADSDDTNTVVISSSGVKSYGNTNTFFTNQSSTGFAIHAGDASNTAVSITATTSSFGPTATEHIQIDALGMRLMDGTTVRVRMNSDGLTIPDGTVTAGSSKFGINVSGNNDGLYVDSNNYAYIDSTSAFKWGGSTNYISGTPSSINIVTDNLAINTATFTASSADSGYISVGPGGNRTSMADIEGVFISGSGEFSMRSGSEYVRFMQKKNIGSTGDNFQLGIATPKFSLRDGGIMTAEDAVFAGDISATSGFFGQSTGSGWNIDGSKIRDADSSIVIDGGASPNITLKDGNYIAEIVPSFTAAASILKAGGLAYNSVTQGWTGTQTQTQTPDLDNGDSSSKSWIAGGFTGHTGESSVYANVESNVGNSPSTTNFGTYSADLTDAVYKSEAGWALWCQIKSMNVLDTTTTNWMSLGDVSYTCKTALYKSVSGGAWAVISDSIESHSGNFFTDFIPDDFTGSGGGPYYANTFKRTITRSYNHTVANDLDDYTWVIYDIVFTNNNLREEYQHSSTGKNASAGLSVTEQYSKIETMAHSPSNKKVEVTPKGIQAVFLTNATLENSDNKYFRMTPDEDKTVDIMGAVHTTGSISISELGSMSKKTVIGSDITLDYSGTGKVKAYTGNFGAVMLDHTGNYGTGNDSIQSIGTGAGGMRFYTAGAVDFAMTDSGDFHADGDIIGYSSTISDIKFKENVRPIENALLKVQKLRGVEFDWKDDFNERGHDVGFIAQEVEKVDGLEVLVKEGYLLNDDNEELTGKRVYYEKVVPLLVEAIKEQQIQIKELQSKVEKLDGNNK